MKEMLNTSKQFKVAPSHVRDYVKKMIKPSAPPIELSPSKTVKEHWNDMHKEPQNLRSYFGSHFCLQDDNWHQVDSQPSSKEGSPIRKTSLELIKHKKNDIHKASLARKSSDQKHNQVTFVHLNRKNEKPSFFTNQFKFKKS